MHRNRRGEISAQTAGAILTLFTVLGGVVSAINKGDQSQREQKEKESHAALVKSVANFMRSTHLDADPNVAVQAEVIRTYPIKDFDAWTPAGYTISLMARPKATAGTAAWKSAPLAKFYFDADVLGERIKPEDATKVTGSAPFERARAARRYPVAVTKIVKLVESTQIIIAQRNKQPTPSLNLAGY